MCNIECAMPRVVTPKASMAGLRNVSAMRGRIMLKEDVPTRNQNAGSKLPLKISAAAPPNAPYPFSSFPCKPHRRPDP